MGAISRDDELFWHRLTIFSVSAGMVGVCLTGIGLFRVVTRLGAVQSLGDELMSVDALLFLALLLVLMQAIEKAGILLVETVGENTESESLRLGNL